MADNKSKFFTFWIKFMKILTWKILIIYLSLSLMLYYFIKNLVGPLNLPDWTLSFIVVFFIACFPAVILFSVVIDTVRHGKDNKDSETNDEKGKPEEKTVERRFQIIDVFLLIAVILLVVFFIIYGFNSSF